MGGRVGVALVVAYHRRFRLALGEEVEVRVWDSTAEIRDLVLPERPAGTEIVNERQQVAPAVR
ncbi:MAG: nitrile hydratase subunit alpha [Dongiaceae bacterium]